MRLQLNGPFRIFDDQDRDVTPKGIKERGLLALLLMSPGQRRTRSWIQDKLWSDRTPEQASGSSRQALSNVRKALGHLGDRLKSDRSAIWIAPPIPIADAFDPAMGELLDDIDIADPEFSDWLRSLRMQQDAPIPAPAFATTPLPVRPHRPIALIYRIDRSGTTRGAFVLRALSQRISAGLGLLGDLDVIEMDAEDRLVADDQPAARVELECLDDNATAFVLIRVTGNPNRRIVWSGRLALAPVLADIWESEEVSRAVNRAVQAVADTVVSTPGLASLSAINRAIRRVFEFDRAGLAKAEELLSGAMEGDLRGPALAWRGFVRLTEALEFREADTAKLDEAMGFGQQALLTAPDHPVVLALTSQTVLRMTGDLDAAHHLATRAVEQGDDNPYALDALCQTLIIQRRYDEANQVALRARRSAAGLPHSFSWDLLACFTALSVGDTAGAFDLALTCHRKMPFYRPALRYLTALSFLTNRPDEANRFADQLRKLEPDFKVQLLLNESYPIGTLRDLDLIEALRVNLLSSIGR
jgi:tetratricopeptide (TPR) repeat protein